MENKRLAALAPRILVLIVDRDREAQLEDVLRERRVRFHYLFHAMGTARSEWLKAFGLSGSEKTGCFCLEPAVKATSLLYAAMDRLELTKPGNGIAFVLPSTGVSALVSDAFSKEMEQMRERLADWMDTASDREIGHTRYELVVSVINQGFSETLMDAARSMGVRGGTIINARRSGIEDMVKFFGVKLQTEKEVVAIVVKQQEKRELMQLISKTCGMNTAAKGITISLPVENCVGLAPELDESMM